jgi:hypothetical protein
MIKVLLVLLCLVLPFLAVLLKKGLRIEVLWACEPEHRHGQQYGVHTRTSPPRASMTRIVPYARRGTIREAGLPRPPWPGGRRGRTSRPLPAGWRPARRLRLPHPPGRECWGGRL